MSGDSWTARRSQSLSLYLGQEAENQNGRLREGLSPDPAGRSESAEARLAHLGALRQDVPRRVDVADNGNESRASPVHHGHSIWRRCATSVSEAKPHD
jgi:hypothetical protein